MSNLSTVAVACAMAFAVTSCDSGSSSSSETETDDTAQVLPETPPTLPEIPPTDDDQAAQGVDRLLGRLQIDYVFSGSTTVFSVSTTYTSSSYRYFDDGSPYLNVSGADDSMGCWVADTVFGEFLCTRIRGIDTTSPLMNLYVFDLSTNLQGTGVFETCIDYPIDAASCVDDFFTSPDGGLVAQVFLSKSDGEEISDLVNGSALDDSQFEAYLISDKLEFGGSVSTFQQSDLPEMPDSVRAAVSEFASKH